MNMTVRRLSSCPSVAFVRTGGALVLALLMVSTAGCGSKSSSGGTGGSVGTGGGGGTSVCSAGSEGCSCYGNDTCNSGLSCLSHLCVNLPGNGGATGTGGAVSTGGATGTGGALSTGGANGTGGALSTGGATGTGGALSTGGANGTGGALGTGGATGTGGAVSTGGATGIGGASGGPLQFVGGYVASTTNSYGIQGAVYTFDDGAGSVISPDCTTGAACFGGTTTPTTKFCVNGSDVAVALNPTMTDYDYAAYWGAAVGFDLNVPTSGTRQPYVASAHHVLGFSMTLTNTVYPTDKVQFSYLVYNGSSNVAYCVAQLNPGPNTVYFTNTVSNCYTTGGVGLTTTNADNLVALQWQVPGSPLSATPFNYCIDNLTPLTQ
jgi:hypothetical protein